ncbi:hydrogenase expression/formation protein HypE [Corynebacterium sp. 13CS0277]|uniref:hydrogenase expression/formation protein HypE n=1 Tax=Corynebacterium sp. 13CS0277 TaxID=2071994 RepID=UPI000D02C83E|nr:hydrogenase expression/formation protein HypE [Corynebacterium sp. 13CS0277]PRQ11629.1 hydrogenase expression/formation protein HypE [Corynebacterium sp. 13CS0277]
MDPKNRLNDNEARVNSNIDRVRARPLPLKDTHVTLAHGSGGKASAALVEHVFMDAYGNEVLQQAGDSGVLPMSAFGAAPGDKLAMSTDSYVVNPVEFPGGTIGELAVNGTVNDLAMAGAVPKFLTAGFVLEEGLDMELLRRIVASMRAAADAAGVQIVAGDTKVVPRGAADKLYITTAGIGHIPAERSIAPEHVTAGDVVLLSGPIADHGMAVMMARGDLAIAAPIESDTRALNGAVEALLAAAPHTRWMRDATRGGVATVCNELARATGMAVVLHDEQIPVRELTRAACDILGIDPLYVANEGTFLAVVPADEADAALAALRAHGAPEATLCGRVEEQPANSVVLVTGFGGTRMVDMLVGDPLPRIC